MKVRPRLLIGSLLVVALLTAGYAIFRASRIDDSGRADDSVTIGDSSPLDQSPVASNPDLVGKNLGQPTLSTNASVVGDKLANAYVRNESGDKLAVSDLLGTPLVLNYWSSTCVPCKKELPDFVTAHDELGDQVRFVGIDAFAPSSIEIDFAKSHGVDYELYFDGDGTLSTALGLTSQPVTLFIRADGTIMRQTGQIDLATIRSSVAELVG